MDAAGVEGDVKLYKASAELLAEVQAKLPLLLATPVGTRRKRVLYHKTAEILRLVSWSFPGKSSMLTFTSSLIASKNGHNCLTLSWSVS